MIQTDPITLYVPSPNGIILKNDSIITRMLTVIQFQTLYSFITITISHFALLWPRLGTTNVFSIFIMFEIVSLQECHRSGFTKYIGFVD